MQPTARQPSRRHVVTLAAAAALGSLPGLGSAQTARREYEPTRGQSGKDVIWIPTPDQVANRLLQLAGVTPQDTVVDLGSGDGKIVIAAARDFKARALGIEFNPDMVELSKRNAQRAGVADRAEFVRGDIFETNFSNATVVTMYLLPQLNLRLRPTLMAMKPGTRLVSHDFDMADWETDELSRAGSRVAHLWVVPANAGGEWRLRFPLRASAADIPVTIEQKFQKIRGNARFDGFETTLREPRLLGDQVAFAFTDSEGVLRDFRGTIAGNRMSGTVSVPSGPAAPFTAERQGTAPPIGGSGPVDRVRLEGSAG